VYYFKNRNALVGILFVLKTGIRWENLPREMGCGIALTCWRRLRDWQAAGVWEFLHQNLLGDLQAAERIDWSRAAIESTSVRALGGAKRPAQTLRIVPDRVTNTTRSRTGEVSRWRRP
jgi:transposase